MQTIREGLAPEVLAEAGATRIPDHHDLTLRYVREFGLPLVPFEASHLRKRLHIAGGNYTSGSGESIRWPLPLTAAEREQGLERLTLRYLLSHTLQLKTHARDRRIATGLMRFEGLTMKQFFARQGISPAAAKLIFLGYPDETGSAAWVLNMVENLTSCRQMYRISGGNDRLPFAFAKRRAGRIQYGSHVLGIGQCDREAWATVDLNGRRFDVRGNALICTLPLTARDLLSTARLSDRKLQVIKSQEYLEATKIFLQMRNQFWVRNPPLFDLFSDEIRAKEFWAMPDHEQDKTWAATPIDPGNTRKRDSRPVRRPRDQ